MEQELTERNKFYKKLKQLPRADYEQVMKILNGWYTIRILSQNIFIVVGN